MKSWRRVLARFEDSAPAATTESPDEKYFCPDPREFPATLMSSTVNLVTAALGSSILSLPYSVAVSGSLLVGFTCLAVSSVAACMSALILVRSCVYVRAHRVEVVVREFFGPALSSCYSVCLGLGLFFAAVSYVVATVELVSGASRVAALRGIGPPFIVTIATTPMPILCILSGFALLPLMIAPRINTYAWTSSVAVVCVLACAALCVWRVVWPLPPSAHPTHVHLETPIQRSIAFFNSDPHLTATLPAQAPSLLASSSVWASTPNASAFAHSGPFAPHFADVGDAATVSQVADDTHSRWMYHAIRDDSFSRARGADVAAAHTSTSSSDSPFSFASDAAQELVARIHIRRRRDRIPRSQLTPLQAVFLVTVPLQAFLFAYHLVMSDVLGELPVVARPRSQPKSRRIASESHRLRDASSMGRSLLPSGVPSAWSRGRPHGYGSLTDSESDSNTPTGGVDVHASAVSQPVIEGVRLTPWTHSSVAADHPLLWVPTVGSRAPWLTYRSLPPLLATVLLLCLYLMVALSVVLVVMRNGEVGPCFWSSRKIRVGIRSQFVELPVPSHPHTLRPAAGSPALSTSLAARLNISASSPPHRPIGPTRHGVAHLASLVTGLLGTVFSPQDGLSVPVPSAPSSAFYEGGGRDDFAIASAAGQVPVGGAPRAAPSMDLSTLLIHHGDHHVDNHPESSQHPAPAPGHAHADVRIPPSPSHEHLKVPADRHAGPQAPLEGPHPPDHPHDKKSQRKRKDWPDHDRHTGRRPAGPLYCDLPDSFPDVFSPDDPFRLATSLLLAVVFILALPLLVLPMRDRIIFSFEIFVGAIVSVCYEIRRTRSRPPSRPPTRVMSAGSGTGASQSHTDNHGPYSMDSLGGGSVEEVEPLLPQSRHVNPPGQALKGMYGTSSAVPRAIHSGMGSSPAEENPRLRQVASGGASTTVGSRFRGEADVGEPSRAVADAAATAVSAAVAAEGIHGPTARARDFHAWTDLRYFVVVVLLLQVCVFGVASTLVHHVDAANAIAGGTIALVMFLWPGLVLLRVALKNDVVDMLALRRRPSVAAACFLVAAAFVSTVLVAFGIGTSVVGVHGPPSNSSHPW